MMFGCSMGGLYSIGNSCEVSNSAKMMKLVDVSMFPTAMNLQVMKLYNLLVSCGKQLTVAMQLLKACPNLCELQIMADEISRKDNEEATSRLLEDPDGCFVIQEMKMLNTIKIEAFSDSALEMLFIKMLLSKSPALERVVIVRSEYPRPSKVRKIERKLKCFPCASPNAQIICVDNYAVYDDVAMYYDWLDTHGFRLIETQ
ncbi:uncharacterized protein LOC116007116 isoform X2 [Ipomoea triloba]|uniref:uncharacterized protein LOC116007116 isoform X2 n=1 Tax=Ipomoea triloba TaxID=35885 RepID=UPI00125D8641|nr:uncharacterized protein LOC116007116 isoform X2 [Ipomoea triloba]